MNQQLVTPVDYDRMWLELDDFIRLNPGARHRRRWLLKELNSSPSCKLLDAGCGNGELLIAIKKARKGINSLTGVDISENVIERNRKRVPGIDFHVLDLEKEALDERFDLIICSEVIEHLLNQRKAMKNLAAMLADYGVLLLTCPTGRVYFTERRFGHLSHPRLHEIKEMAHDNGLRALTALNWGFPFYRILKWLTNVNPEWSVENFAAGGYSLRSKMISHICYYVNFLNLPASPWGCQLMIRFQKIRG